MKQNISVTILAFLLIILGCQKQQGNAILGITQKAIVHGTVFFDGIPSDNVTILAKKRYSSTPMAKLSSTNAVETTHGKYKLELEAGEYEIIFSKDNKSSTRIVSLESGDIKECFVDINLPTLILEVESNGSYIKVTNMGELYVKRPNSIWQHITPLTNFYYYDTANTPGLYQCKSYQCLNNGTRIDSLAIAINIGTSIPVIREATVVDSGLYNHITATGYFDFNKYGMAVYRVNVDSSLELISIVETYLRESGSTKFFFCDTSANFKNTDKYALALIEKSTNSFGAPSYFWRSNGKSTAVSNVSLIDAIDELIIEYSSNKKTFDGRWILFRRELGKSDYVPFDTTYEVLSSSPRYIIRSKKRLKGIFDYKVINFSQQNIILIDSSAYPDNRLNTNDSVAYAIQAISQLNNNCISIMPYLRLGTTGFCNLPAFNVLIWRCDLISREKTFLDSVLLNTRINDSLPFANKGQYAYEVAARLPDGTLSVRFTTDAVIVPDKITFAPSLEVFMKGNYCVEFGCLRPHIREPKYAYAINLKIARFANYGNNQGLVVIDTSMLDYNFNGDIVFFTDSAVSAGSYTYKAWYESRFFNICSDTLVFNNIQVNDKIASPYFSVGNSDNYPIVNINVKKYKFERFNVEYRNFDSIAIIRNTGLYSDTTFNTLSSYDTLRIKSTDSIMYSVAYIRNGTIGDFSTPVKYCTKPNIETPTISVILTENNTTQIFTSINSYADSIRIYRAVNSDTTYLLLASFSSRHSNYVDGWQDTLTEENSTYHYKTIAICGTLESKFSNSVSICTGNNPLPQCSLSFVEHDIGDTIFTKLRWSHIDGANRYEIYRNSTFLTAINAANTEYTDTEIPLTSLPLYDIYTPTTCRYKIRAMSDNRTGLFSKEYEVSYKYLTMTVRLIK